MFSCDFAVLQKMRLVLSNGPYQHIFKWLSQRRKTETKPDIYSKDRIFVTSFAFCVITYEPIEVQTFSAPQNHRQNLGFVKDIKVVVEKMTRNRRKVIGKPGDSLLCRLHSIQVSSLVYSFLYGYQGNHQNWVPSLLPFRVWLIFMWPIQVNLIFFMNFSF